MHAAEKRLSLQELSPLSAQIVLEKKITGLFRLKKWLKLLHEVEMFDQATGLQRKATTKRTVLVGILCFFLLFGNIIGLQDVSGPATVVAFVLADVVVLGLLVFLIVRGRRLRTVDLADDFKEVLLPFLGAFGEDISPGGKVRLALDLSGPTKGKILRKQEIPPGRFRKVVETVYADPWCQVDAPLAEGSRLILDIHNTYTVLDRKWRTSRGKYKSKRKWKKLVSVKAGLIPNAETYSLEPDQTTATALKAKLKVAQKKDAQIATLQRKFKFSSVNEMPSQYLEVDELIRMFFLLGRSLKPS
jgi:hypothetical protein